MRRPHRAPDGAQNPLVRDILVFPPVEGSCRVYFELLDLETLNYRPGVCYPAIPYTPFSPRLRSVGTHDDYVRFLHALAEDRYPQIEWRYAWWREGRWNYAIWMGASFAIVGLIWPAVVRRFAGEAPARGEQDEMPPPSSFVQDRNAMDQPPSASMASPAPDAACLNERVDELIRSQLAEMQSGQPSFAPSTTDAVRDPSAEQPAVPTLNATPLESPAPKAPEQPQEYDGEYYPTVAHAKRKQSDD